VLSSVGLQLSQTGAGQDIQSVAFRADSSARTVSVTGTAGTINLNVDMSDSAIWGSQSQQAAAISSYLKQFDQERARGHGDASLMAMFGDAFTQMNSHYGGTSSQSLPGAVVPMISQADHAMLTGLADFSASVTDKPQASNPMRPGEDDSFSYEVSQNTDAQGNAVDGTITQQQQSSLHASYHVVAASNGPLTSMKASQNYAYLLINDTAESTTRIENEGGKIEDASLSHSADQSTREMKYVKGNLVSDVTTPSDISQSQDLLALLKPLFENGQAAQDGSQWQQALAGIHGMILLQADPSGLSGK
jgi:hypothetical protein